ncbi:MSCRAMM family protein [Enterococcus faecium]|uniref:SpaA isopeptide-forming pilin-related protein n=1 Tax=Enterococcus faecium TaxID=1352 RepID=A0A9X3XSD3_ENTFC|nr:SpaA isopeptide-forming pilin-related protein [Enterococcus faecium]MDC4248081.1 SpaA isopeptide-forming pilin-related protein [Enterococcus faecium]
MKQKWLGHKLVNLFMVLTILFGSMGTPLSVLAETQRDTGQIEQVDQASEEAQEQETPTVETTEETSGEPTQTKEQPTEANSETANANDSPKIVDPQGNLYDLNGEKVSTIENERKETAQTIQEEVQKEAEKVEEKKVPTTFEEVDMDDAESILLALNNPDFPFASIEEVFAPKQKASEQMETYKKSRDWFLARYNELTKRRNLRLFKAMNSVSGGVLTIQEINPPTGYPWIAVQTHGGQVGYAHDKIYKFMIGGNVLFCIQPGKTAGVGQNHTVKTLDSLVGAAKAKDLTAMAEYGWYSQSDKSNIRYVAVQLAIWGYLGDTLSKVTPQWDSTVRSIITDIKNNYKKLLVKPSFHNETQTIKVGQTATFTDKNNSLNNVYVASVPKGVTATISGNTLKVTASASAPNTGTVKLGKGKIGAENAGFVSGNYQHLGLLPYNDPNIAWINLKVQKEGQVKIKKVDSDTGKVISGAKFKLSYGGKQVEVVTNANGEAELKNIAHGTEVTIQEIQAANGYVINKSTQKVTVEAEQTKTVTFKNVAQKGTISIDKSGVEFKKTMPNGNYTLAGNVFEVFAGSKAEGTPVDTVTTDANGKAKTKALPLGTYAVKEKTASAGYVLNPTVYVVKITYAGQTVEVTNTDQKIENKEQKGTISIDKSGVEFQKTMPNGNYTLSGNVFEVFAGEKAEGKPVDTVTTDANGKVKTKALPLGTYAVKEKTASAGYVLNPTVYVVKIAYAGQTVEVTNTDQKIENKEQKGSVVLSKQDSETGSVSQGDTTFVGAEFDLFRKADHKKIGHYTTNANGQLTVNNLLIDTYYFIETKAPVGYVLDQTPVEFSIEYAGQTASVVKQANAVKKNKVITGGFDLIKTANYNWYTTAWNWLTGKDPSDQPTVLEGVEFTVKQDFGKKEVVRKSVTDKQGYVSFDKLPYGTYVVSETKTPVGYKGIADFKVTISKDGQRFHYVVENKVKEAKVKFVKIDAETGKPIVRSHAGFEIYSKTTGEQLRMKDLQGKEQSVFYTDEEGVLQLPIQFAFGQYYAKEVKAPVGYVLAKNTVNFEVTGNEKDGLVVVTIKNDNQKGQLTLHKTVQTAVSVTEKESDYGMYSEIQFDQGNGEGFSFKIRPTEDIVTADGTTRFTAGEFLQKDGQDQVWTTDSEGNFQTEPFLYIGKYEAVEVQAPAGVNLQDVTPIPFEITYAGQNVAITSTTATAENYLQKVNLYGHKQQEVVTGWEDGKAIVEVEPANNGQVFALRTGQELQIGDTTLEPDTTLGYAVVKDGVLSFENMLLPNVKADYYLQEVNAGSDHVLVDDRYPFTYTPTTNEREHEIHVWADSFVEKGQEESNSEKTPIDNKLARAAVKLVKTDDLDGQPLENVAFDLVRIDPVIGENGEETTTDTVISKHATNAKGEIFVENLPTGRYKFVESRPLEWYKDNTDDLSFTVTPKEDGTVIEVNAVNYRKPLEITTKFATMKDSHKQANPDIDNDLIDYVTVDGMKLGHTYTVDTAYVNRDTKEVVSTSTSEITTDKEGTFEFTTELSLPKGTLKDGTRLTATHIIYEDKEKTKEIGRHDDLENDDQTVTFKSPKVSIHTKAHTGDNKTQTFTHGDLITAYDNVNLSHENVLDGTKRAFETILVAQTPDGKMTDIWSSGKIDYVVKDSTIVKQVKTKVDTSKYPEGTTFFFKEVGYNEAGEKDSEHNFDGKDKEQALTPVKKKVLPKTGSKNEMIWVIIGVVFVLAASMITYQINRKEN